MSIDPCDIDGVVTATRCPVCWRPFCGDHIDAHAASHTDDERKPEMVRRAEAAAQEGTEGDPEQLA